MRRLFLFIQLHLYPKTHRFPLSVSPITHKEMHAYFPHHSTKMLIGFWPILQTKMIISSVIKYVVEKPPSDRMEQMTSKSFILGRLIIPVTFRGRMNPICQYGITSDTSKLHQILLRSGNHHLPSRDCSPAFKTCPKRVQLKRISASE